MPTALYRIEQVDTGVGGHGYRRVTHDENMAQEQLTNLKRSVGLVYRDREALRKKYPLV